MKGSTFRRLLSRLALIGVPAAVTVPATTGCPYCGEDTGEVEHDVLLAPGAGSELDRLVTRCETEGICLPLCEHVVTELDEYAEEILECTLTETASQQRLYLRYYDGSVCGRRPAGLARTRPGSGDPIAAWLAHAAHLEAASVPAFERLAADLVRHAAPAPLVEGAREAARDELRHAACVGALARVRGARPVAVAVARCRPRSLAAIAVDNAVEGCVRETFGAIVARRQAVSARDRDVRAALTRIAPDEARHAELAHAIDAWARPRLTAGQRRRLDLAQRAAVTELRVAVTIPFPRRACAALGLPSPAVAARILDEAAGSLGWER